MSEDIQKENDEASTFTEIATPADRVSSPAHGMAGHVHGPGCSHHHASHDPFVRGEAKVGRNDPCVCGSNQKFKKCCGK